MLDFEFKKRIILVIFLTKESGNYLYDLLQRIEPSKYITNKNLVLSG